MSEMEDGVRIGQYILRFEEEDYIDAEYVEKARKELRETAETKKVALEELKRLLAEEKDLYLPLDDNDSYLYAFLRACKFYPDSAFERIKLMYQFRKKYPKYFLDVTPMNEKNVFKNNLLTISPQRDQHGRRILIVQLGSKWKFESCSLTEITRGIVLAIEAAVLEPKTQISGSIIIMDFQGLSIQHVWQFTPAFAQVVLYWLQNCMPLRIKAIHIINQPYIFNMAFSIFKPFLTEKFRNRMYFHGSKHSSLLCYIDPKFTPSQYGGMMDLSLDEGETIWKFFYRHNDRYEKTSRYGYNRTAEK